MDARTAAFLGVAGGAGATRLAVETAGVLARDGASVGVLDAAYATQGLSQYVTGRIDPDVTTAVTGDAGIADARHDLAPDTAGALAVYPAFAPFTGIADAKTPAAAEQFEAAVDDLAATHDYVLVDTPPVAANQAVAAVTATDATAAVLPPGDRGVDSLQRARGRLADVGASVDLAVANRVADAPPDADLAVPEHQETGIPAEPVALTGDGEFTEAVAALAEHALDATVDVDFQDESILDAARQKLA